MSGSGTAFRTWARETFVAGQLPPGCGSSDPHIIDSMPSEMQHVRDTSGLGLSTVRSEGLPGVGLLIFTSTTPVEVELSIMRCSLFVTRNIADSYGDDFMNGIVNGVRQDFPIWTDEIHRANPVFCETDAYIAELRHWTRQSYSETAGVAPACAPASQRASGSRHGAQLA